MDARTKYYARDSSASEPSETQSRAPGPDAGPTPPPRPSPQPLSQNGGSVWKTVGSVAAGAVIGAITLEVYNWIKGKGGDAYLRNPEEAAAAAATTTPATTTVLPIPLPSMGYGPAAPPQRMPSAHEIAQAQLEILERRKLDTSSKAAKAQEKLLEQFLRGEFD